MIKTFCNECKNEVTRNMITEPLVITSSKFQIAVGVTVYVKDEHPALCCDCLISMLTTEPKKPRKPRSDKGSIKRPKTEQIKTITPELREMEEGLNSEGLTLVRKLEPEIEQVLTKRIRKAKVELPEVTDKKGSPDISTFSIKTPEPGTDDPYTLSLGGHTVVSRMVKDSVTELMGIWNIDQAFVENAPDSEGKRNLLDILREGGK